MKRKDRGAGNSGALKGRAEPSATGDLESKSIRPTEGRGSEARYTAAVCKNALGRVPGVSNSSTPQAHPPSGEQSGKTDFHTRKSEGKT